MDVARTSEDAKKDPARFARDVLNAEEWIQYLIQEIRITFYIHRHWMRGISSARSWYVQGLAECSSLAIDYFSD
jgi:hypothetical protein